MVDIDDFAFELECAAEWRRQQAAEYKTAAELLGKLTREVRALEGSLVHHELDAAMNETLKVKYSIVELTAYRRELGITQFPDSGEIYLRKLMEILLAPVHAQSRSREDVKSAGGETASRHLPHPLFSRALVMCRRMIEARA